MIKFLIKRSFLSWWENLLASLFINLFFLLHLILIFASAFYLIPISVIPGMGLLILTVISLFFFLVTSSQLVFDAVKNHRRISFKAFFNNYGKSSKSAIPMLVFNAVFFGLLFFTLRNYTLVIKENPGLFSAVGFFLLTWIFLFSFMALGYFFGLRHHMNDSFFVTLKKCFIMFFSNPGVSFSLIFFSVLQLLISLSVILLLPGISSVLFLWEEAVRLLMLKYDYLEENPGLDMKKFPWDTVLKEEKEKAVFGSMKDMLNL